MDSVRKNAERSTAPKSKSTRKKLISICSCCHKNLEGESLWQRLKILPRDHSSKALSHGLCPACYEEQRAAYRKFKAHRAVHHS